jgi:hypothetical protein
MTTDEFAVHNGHGQDEEKTSEASTRDPDHGGDVKKLTLDNRVVEAPDEEPKRTVTGLKVC